jgi:hypothetical protein
MTPTQNMARNMKSIGLKFQLGEREMIENQTEHITSLGYCPRSTKSAADEQTTHSLALLCSARISVDPLALLPPDSLSFPQCV